MKTYKSIFISDIHLGTKDSEVEKLLLFLKDIECENLFLVGDIIDGWELRRAWRWDQHHSDFIQKLLRRARKGTKIYYILGNHDEFLRHFLPIAIGDNIELCDEFVYNALDGKKYLVIHGDLFDTITMTKKWLAYLGDKTYLFLLRLNKPLNFIRMNMLGCHYWSLSRYLKLSVKKAVNYIFDYEFILASHTKLKGLDGVICGHIHEAAIKDIDTIKYLNCGDWVESCTAIAENYSGDWEILKFSGTN